MSNSLSLYIIIFCCISSLFLAMTVILLLDVLMVECSDNEGIFSKVKFIDKSFLFLSKLRS